MNTGQESNYLIPETEFSPLPNGLDFPDCPTSTKYEDWECYIDKHTHLFLRSNSQKRFTRFVLDFHKIKPEGCVFIQRATAYLHSQLMLLLSRHYTPDTEKLILNLLEHIHSKLQVKDLMALFGLIPFNETNRQRIIRVFENYLISNCSKESLNSAAKWLDTKDLKDEICMDKIWIPLTNKQIVKEFLISLSSNSDRFHHVLVAFKISQDGLMQFIAKLIEKCKMTNHDFEFVFYSSRIKSMVFDRKKFGWEIVEEKINNVKDLKPFLKFLLERNHMKEAFSIFHRLGPVFGLRIFGKLTNLNYDDHYMPNTLQSCDKFGPCPNKSEQNCHLDYLTLSYLDYNEPSVYWVNFSDLLWACHIIESQSQIGIDAEFYRTDFSYTTLFQLATLQIATSSQVFIFDGISLKEDENFKLFIIRLFKNPQIQKIGFSFNSDLEVIERSLQISSLKIDNLIDLGYDPTSREVWSLARFVERFIGKPLCKREQGSAWNKRPLRKAQLHYAALDAVVCLKMSSFLEDIKEKRIVFSSQSLKTEYIVKEEPLSIDRPKSKSRSKRSKKNKGNLFHQNEHTDKKIDKFVAESQKKFDFFKINSEQGVSKCELSNSTRPSVSFNPTGRANNQAKGKSMMSRSQSNQNKKCFYNKSDSKFQNKFEKSNLKKMKTNLSSSNSNLQHVQQNNFKNSNSHQNNHFSFNSQSEWRPQMNSQQQNDRIRNPTYTETSNHCGKPHNYVNNSNFIMEANPKPVFVVSGELKNLVTKMRKFGLDTHYTYQVPPSLIKDRAICIYKCFNNNFDFHSYQDSYKIQNNHPLEQFTEVIRNFNIKFIRKDVMSRCFECNSLNFFLKTPDEIVLGKTLDVRQSHVGDLVWKCTECGFLYSEGSDN
jgi:uncharacterized protein with PIN domain